MHKRSVQNSVLSSNNSDVTMSNSVTSKNKMLELMSPIRDDLPYDPEKYLKDILIFRNFISNELCDDFIKDLSQIRSIEKKINTHDLLAASAQTYLEHLKNLKAKSDMAKSEFNNALGQWIKLIIIHSSFFCNHMSTKFNVKFKGIEIPESWINSGDVFIQTHSDAEKFNLEKKIWERKQDRDYSSVLYLNDDFENGDLLFPWQNIKVRPEKGMMIGFPASHEFIHKVTKITKGTRYSMSSWASVYKNNNDLINIDTRNKDWVPRPIISTYQNDFGEVSDKLQNFINECKALIS